MDRLLGASQAGRAATPLAKGLSGHTLDMVSRSLREQDGDASAQQVGDAVGISRVSARRYLAPGDLGEGARRPAVRHRGTT